MTKLLLILMVVGVWSGCGGDSPTEPTTDELLVGTWDYYVTDNQLLGDWCSVDGDDCVNVESILRTCEYKESGVSECSSVLYEGLTFFTWRIEDNLLYEVPIQPDGSKPWIIEFLDVDTILITQSNDETNKFVGKRKERDD